MTRVARSTIASVTTPIPIDLHEWVSFEDHEEDRTWVFDVTFLTSSWNCIFGNGCQGVLTGPAEELVQGCCSYGAHFVDADDVARVEAVAATLTAEEWQFKDKAKKKGTITTNDDGDTVTRLVDDACIFLNRPGFPTGPGCAIHYAAISRGTSYVEMKPEVCWQLPLRRDEAVDDRGHVTTTITQWDRKHWGDGGADFHWWCTEDPAAFTGHEPVYRTMRTELETMAGTKVYKRLAAYLAERTAPKAKVTLLPHPTVRR